MRRGDLTAAEWRALRELLATMRGPRGRPLKNSRAVINGILWRLRTGAPWRDIPGRYGDWNTIYRRFRRWRQSDIWDAVAEVLGVVATDTAPSRSSRRRIAAGVAAARPTATKRPASR